MKTILKINFSDFWKGFDKTNNYFYNLLSTKYDLIIDDNPDFLIFSSYGTSYLKYNCPKIFYTAENERADYTCCDLAITFDYKSNKKHFRLPLYVLYIDRANKLSDLTNEITKEEAYNLWKFKEKFCCIVISNGNAKKRLQFFDDISAIRKVDSGGRFMNNIGGEAVEDKLDFIKDYKFVISYENSTYPGYTTEKIIEPFFVNSIPIYWGNPEVDKDFNPSTFIDASKFKSNNEIINLMLQIENNKELAIKYLCPSKIEKFSDKDYFNKARVLNFIERAMEVKKPVAKNYFYSNIHRIKIKLNILIYYLIRRPFGYFR